MDLKILPQLPSHVMAWNKELSAPSSAMTVWAYGVSLAHMTRCKDFDFRHTSWCLYCSSEGFVVSELQ